MHKTYLVSGAGSGIGRGIALQLATASPDNAIVLLGRDAKKLEATRRELPAPDRHRIAVGDIRDAASLRRAFKEAGLEQANLAGVIANAGIGGENRYGDGDRWSEILGTNLTGTYQLVNEALPALRKSGEPYKHVILVASILARLGVPGYSAYCASKAGLLGLMRSWSAELAREKILVNAICPGWVDTDMAREGVQAFAQATGKSYDEALKEQMKPVPLRKMSQPAEIGALAAYLVSPIQTSITGQALDINNGALMP